MSPLGSSSGRTTEIRQQAAVAGVLWVFLIALWSIKGTCLSPDSRTFSSWADILVAHNFSYLALFSRAASTAPPLLYTGIITLIALLKVVFGVRWAAFLVLINACAMSAVSVILFRLISRISSSPAAPWLGSVLLMGCWDLLQWVRYALSDITFLAIVTGICALACQSLIESEKHIAGSSRRTAIVLGLGTLVTFYRPTGVLVWPSLLFYLWARHQLLHGRQIPAFRKLAGLTGFLAVAAIFANAFLMAHPGRFPSSATISHQVRHYRSGEIVWDRPDTFQAPPVQVIDYARISACRWVWYWAIWTRDFSLKHSLLNAIFFIPIYGLTLITLWTLLREDGDWSQGQKAALGVLVIFVATVSTFHAVIQVDYDWRYRLPVLCPLIVLAACGFGTPRLQSVLFSLRSRLGVP